MIKTFKVYTLGCKVNQYESQGLREKMCSFGIKEAGGKGADIYIVNTCTVTRKADKESRNLARSIYRSNRLARIFITGCSADIKPKEFAHLKGVKGVFTNKQKQGLPEAVAASLGFKPHKGSQRMLLGGFAAHTRAFVKIQDGCSHACSYCIVPKARGISRSRPLEEIIEEAGRLACAGFKELVLCGICLGAYGKDLKPRLRLVDVVDALSNIKGLARIRLSSIEASDVDAELIKRLKSQAKLCRHLHIPFQSGDDKILKLMNRKYSSRGYLDLIERLRKASSNIGITTDMIVGFPGEDDASFKKTIAFLKKARPSRMHIFTFSPRQGTAAFNFKGRPAPGEVKKRAAQLKALSSELRLAFCRHYIGRKLSVLFESSPDQATGLAKGYSDNYIKAYLPGVKPLGNSLLDVTAVKPCRDGVLARL